MPHCYYGDEAEVPHSLQAANQGDTSQKGMNHACSTTRTSARPSSRKKAELFYEALNAQNKSASSDPLDFCRSINLFLCEMNLEQRFFLCRVSQRCRSHFLFDKKC